MFFIVYFWFSWFSLFRSFGNSPDSLTRKSTLTHTTVVLNLNKYLIFHKFHKKFENNQFSAYSILFQHYILTNFSGCRLNFLIHDEAKYDQKSRENHGQSKSGRYIRAFLSYGAFFSFEIRGSYLQIMNHLKDRYVQFVKSSYLLFFILCMVLGPYRRKNRNYSSHNHATLLFWFPSDRAVTTCTRARVLPDILLPWRIYS